MRKLPVVPICRRSSGLPKLPNQAHIAPVPRPREGRFAIVTSVGRGTRWTLAARATSAAEADGEIVWSWRPWAGAKVAGDDPANDGDYEVTDTGEQLSCCRPALGRPQGWREARPRLRRLAALTPSAHRSLGFASARSRTERNLVALVMSTRSEWRPTAGGA